MKTETSFLWYPRIRAYVREPQDDISKPAVVTESDFELQPPFLIQPGNKLTVFVDDYGRIIAHIEPMKGGGKIFTAFEVMPGGHGHEP